MRSVFDSQPEMPSPPIRADANDERKDEEPKEDLNAQARKQRLAKQRKKDLQRLRSRPGRNNARIA